MLLIMGFVLYVILSAAGLPYALVKGGPTERKVASVWLLGVVISQVASQFGYRWTQLEVPVFIVDVLLFAALLSIAHRSERFWPLWTASLQLAGVLTHLAFVLQPSISREAYAGLQGFWGIPILCTIIVGTARHQMATAQSGAPR